MRAAQSKGIVDLLALWSSTWSFHEAITYYDNGKGVAGWLKDKPYPFIPQPWLVQCKYSIHGGGTLPPIERGALKELAEKTGGIPVLARPGKNGRGVEFINLKTEEHIV